MMGRNGVEGVMGEVGVSCGIFSDWVWCWSMIGRVGKIDSCGSWVIIDVVLVIEF